MLLDRRGKFDMLLGLCLSCLGTCRGSHAGTWDNVVYALATTCLWLEIPNGPRLRCTAGSPGLERKWLNECQIEAEEELLGRELLITGDQLLPTM
jgi:hypothetical protein